MSDPNCPRCKGTGERETGGDLHRSPGLVPCNCLTPTQPPQRCEPGEAYRRQGSLHFLRNGELVRVGRWIDHYGDGAGLVWRIEGMGGWGAAHAYERGWRYVGAIPTQTQQQVDALVEAARDAADCLEALYQNLLRADVIPATIVSKSRTALAPFQNRGENSDAE